MGEETQSTLSILPTSKATEAFKKALINGFDQEGKNYNNFGSDITADDNSNYVSMTTNYSFDRETSIALSKHLGTPVFLNEVSPSADGGEAIGYATSVDGDNVITKTIKASDCKDNDYLDEDGNQDDDKWHSFWDDMTDNTDTALDELIKPFISG